MPCDLVASSRSARVSHIAHRRQPARLFADLHQFLDEQQRRQFAESGLIGFSATDQCPLPRFNLRVTHAGAI
jgi:hypothetical protein